MIWMDLLLSQKKGRGTINVITWTDTKLVTNIPDEMDAGSGTLTWTKSAGVNI